MLHMNPRFRNFAKWVKNSPRMEFTRWCKGLYRKNGRSWPPSANTYARKSAWILPLIAYLIREGFDEKAEELTDILLEQARREG